MELVDVARKAMQAGVQSDVSLATPLESSSASASYTAPD